nr:pyrimidine dimer DNA glycosylase/endonuclease V [uncultured Desulfobulbus sp.]
MNIFVLDLDIERCARYHCDQHVVKMILESAQIACTALNLKGFATPYKSTHVRHPCIRWAGESYDNFLWLVRLARALNSEYCYRYEKTKDHNSIAVLDQIESIGFESLGLTEFPQAMPEQYRVVGDPVAAYRNFYKGDKRKFARWTKRNPPAWFLDL